MHHRQPLRGNRAASCAVEKCHASPLVPDTAGFCTAHIGLPSNWAGSCHAVDHADIVEILRDADVLVLSRHTHEEKQ